MKQNVILSLVVSLSLGLAACSEKTKETQNIDKSVQANAKADSLMAWDSSEFNPEKLFVEWNRKLVAKEIEVSGLCGDFSEVPAEDLVLFENQIRSKENLALIQDCQGSLVTKLDEYWTANRPVINAGLNSDYNRNSFKFPDLVETRNLDNGYFAVSGDVGTKEVILTFDDGPSGLYTQTILDSMKQVNAKGIFFMTGNHVKQLPDLVHKVSQAGHAIGGHSMNHMCLPSSGRCESNNKKAGFRMLSVTEAMADIRNTFNTIVNVLGYSDPFFRFPYGESSKELRSYLTQNGIGEFYWSIDSNDWQSKTKDGVPWTPVRMVDEIMRQLNANSKKRGMILVHDIQKKTSEAIPSLLQRLYYEGYSLVLLKSEDSNNMTNPKILGGQPEFETRSF